MPRPFTRAQALQNLAFLAALRRTGNVRLAARELDVHRSTFTKRRTRDAAFAAEWDAALAFAHAALADQPLAPEAPADAPGHGQRTRGGEVHVVRRRSGRLQLRRALPGRITQAAEQAFLAALSATANVRLSAAAAGFSHASFYARARVDPCFAREMRLALAMGHQRLELALLANMDPESYAHDSWRHNDPPPIPPMTAAEALQLLSLHWKSARLEREDPDRRYRRGEGSESYSRRLAMLWRRDRSLEAENYALELAWKKEGTPAQRLPHEHPAPPLPALAAVKAQEDAKRARRKPALPDLPPAVEAAKATGLPALPAIDDRELKLPKNRRVQDPDRAMFGGWRFGTVPERAAWRNGKG
jgi:hypothetical protein